MIPKIVSIKLLYAYFMQPMAIFVILSFIQQGNCQQLSTLNTPPVLYVAERNWRIDEKEPVGQIISRIRADDSENDNLVFGLEPHFYSSFENSNSDGETPEKKVPFWIDPTEGIVYLNESLVGRGGENFFFYITVSDGQLTAKNEIYVNILSHRERKKTILPHSISHIVQNISQILPPFDQLPGVQIIKNQNINHSQFTNPLNFGINPTYPVNSWPVNSITNETRRAEEHTSPETRPKPEPDISSSTPTSRTKLTRLSDVGSTTIIGSQENVLNTSNVKNSQQNDTNRVTASPTDLAVTFNPAIIPTIVVACGLILVPVLLFGFLYRKKLCAVGKTLKKDSKSDMTKKSNQSTLNENFTDDSHNSMVLQHWNGPTAFGNRYVPWERDQQPHIVSSQLPIGALGDPSLEGNGGSLDGGNDTQFQRDVWEFPRHRLKFFNILGEGAFGQVWRCEALNINGVEGVTTVAVKTLKENASEVDKKDLMSELEVMKSLSPHLNVVRFLGCCTDKEPIFVILEYVNRGKLQTYLRNSRAERHYGNTHGKSKTLTSSDLTSFMYQVAKGMDYLTSQGIIHRDLAARNILITDDHTCKVADFGFARDIITSKVYERKSEGKLPIRWMATESLYDNIFSVKSDIWSFGVLMWEIVTLGSTPYPGISAADVMRKVRSGYRLEKPEHCRRELYNIMYYCWSSNPNERPSFSEIVSMLDKLLHTEMDYIELELFPDHNYYNITNLSDEKL